MTKFSESEFLNKAQSIKVLVCDVNGVLTAEQSSIQLSLNFNSDDDKAICELINNGITVAIISVGSNPKVRAHYEQLHPKFQPHHICLGSRNKMLDFQDLLTSLDYDIDDAAYIGDGSADYDCIKAAGTGITVPNACSEVKSVANWQTERYGGEGAVCEIAELIMKTRKQR